MSNKWLNDSVEFAQAFVRTREVAVNAYKDEHFYDDDEAKDDDPYDDMIATPIEETLPVLPAAPPMVEDGWAMRDCPVCKRALRKRIHDVLHCECGVFHWL